MAETTFRQFFSRATGQRPFRYQEKLAALECPPDVLEIPTGGGKTLAALVAWIYHRRVLGTAPRRLVYALPMRTLVEQTHEVATGVRERLGLSAEDLPIHVLMGGEPPSDWREHPERGQVLIGTVDMLLSRALNRGYGESRFAWPVSFGLLNADCRWVFDEVQLMGPARASSAQLDGLRAKLGTVLPCETTWMSATIDREALATYDRPDLGKSLILSAADRKGTLGKRLSAAKRLERVDLTGASPASAPREIAAVLAGRHVSGTRTIAVLNRVGKAQAVYDALGRVLALQDDPPELVLLHSRFRSPERADRTAAALAPVDGGPGLIVVSTQVIEAGIDVSSRVLATETAPFSSIVQRAGRCNRTGEYPEAEILWLDSGSQDAKQARPYDAADLDSARQALMELDGQSLSPDALASMEVAERRASSAVLRRRDLLDLFDTAPDLSGLDVDVSRFIRDDDLRSVSVFFRAVSEHDPGSEHLAPVSAELVDVPIHELGTRESWVFDFVDAEWVRASTRTLRSGETVMLEVRDGGYSAERGWDPTDREPVVPLAPASGATEEATGSDPLSATGSWVALADHLAQSHREAKRLVEGLGLANAPAVAEAVVNAAALHDVGKAHPVFQETLRSTAREGDPAPPGPGTLLAKSVCGGGRHSRRFFRHELASALCVRGGKDGVLLPDGNEELVCYLIAAHHGRVRLAIRPAPDEQRPRGIGQDAAFALGVADGDELPAVETPIGIAGPATLDLRCMALGGTGTSWAEAACLLRDDPCLGPFRLGLLEALLRIADWRASG